MPKNPENVWKKETNYRLQKIAKVKQQTMTDIRSSSRKLKQDRFQKTRFPIHMYISIDRRWNKRLEWEEKKNYNHFGHKPLIWKLPRLTAHLLMVM